MKTSLPNYTISGWDMGIQPGDVEVFYFAGTLYEGRVMDVSFVGVDCDSDTVYLTLLVRMRTTRGDFLGYREYELGVDGSVSFGDWTTVRPQDGLATDEDDSHD